MFFDSFSDYKFKSNIFCENVAFVNCIRFILFLFRMPKIVSGNTNAAAVLIGEKCADFIKYQWTNSGKEFAEFNPKDEL